MREHRLLDRIRLLNQNPSRRVSEDPKQMIRSIQDHLQRILNTRQGSVPISEEYGVPDFTNFMGTYSESQRHLERDLRQTIQRFEPRLQGVRVRFFPREDDPLTITFQITARLALEGEKDPILFQSTVDSTGHIRIRA